jgi:long-chain acyl-CoA synthetase
MQSAIGNLLDSTARRYGTKKALITPDRALTFAELDRLSTRFAAGLTDLGVQPGDRVTLWLDNGWRWVVAYYGILRAGGVVNPANALLTTDELQYMVNDCDSRFLISRALKTLRPAASRGLTVIAESGDIAAGVKSFDDLLERGGASLHRWQPPAIKRTNICSIFYTSGTTGYPKGVVLRHDSLLLNVAMTSLMHGMHDDDTIVSALPCAHVYGNVVLNTAIACGMTLVLLPRLDELAILEAVESHRATVLEGVPSMYLALLNIADIERFDLGSLRLCAVGGQSMAVNKMEEIEARLRAPLVELWGMTEIAGLGTTHPYNGPRNLGSIGIPLPFTEIRVADPDDASRDTPTGGVGELLVRGPHVMEGYFNRPRDTELTIETNGWLHSGDLVRRDERGYLYIVDRIKDVILSGGYTVYPAEIERVISQFPGVSAAVAVPVADELRGEIVKALVVLRPGTICTPEDVVAHCRERLAPYKVPRAMEFVSHLPTGSTGKIIRRAVSRPPGLVTQLDITRKLP